ncbi:MAG TPA: DUF3570 domain-containing protein [Polyangia bacterium]
MGDRAVTRARSLAATVALTIAIALPRFAGAEPHPGEVRAGVDVFAEPASGLSLTVVTPSVNGKVDLRRWLTAYVDWTADVVSGATPRTYGAVDAISSATAFSEVRNQVGAAVEARTGPFSLRAGYHFSIENDYRSHQLALDGRIDLLQHDTIIDVRWAHDFDSVCDLDNRGLSVLQRQPLSNSVGCFAGHAGLTEEPLGVDAVEVSLTQTLTPRLIGVLTGYSEHLAGFQSNPYRRVALLGDAILAQESDPGVRDRGAVGVKLRYAATARGALGADVRLYRDTWDIESLTAQLSWDQLLLGERLRLQARARYYQQSQAFFFRDAGSAGSYEKTGPVGAYFTGDRELSPFSDLLIGGALYYRARPLPGRRLGRMFHALDVGAHLTLMKFFSFAITPPDAPRMSGVIDALTAGLSAVGEF